MNSTPAQSIDEWLLAEHRRIREITDRFDSAAGLPELLAVLAEARPTLAAHFSGEEADEGFYDRVRSMAPNQTERVDRLEREHQAFLSEVDGLAARAQACLAGPVAQIFGDARSLAQRIRKHEVAEDQIVADSLYGDLGQGD